MKKLLVPLLFFGSFGLAMAQASPTMTGWAAFRSLLSRPPVIRVAPIVRSTARVAAPAPVAPAAVSAPTGDQRYCRNEAPVSASYCARGRGDTGDGTRCYTLTGCIGATDNPRNPCRPAPQCTPAASPLAMTATIAGLKCAPKPPMPDHCASMTPTPNDPYCYAYYMDSVWQNQTGEAQVTVTMSGGTPPYNVMVNGQLRTSSGGSITVPITTYPGASVTVNGYDSRAVPASPITLTAPSCQPTQDVCAGIDIRVKESIEKYYRANRAAGEDENDALKHAQEQASADGQNMCNEMSSRGCQWFSPGASGVGGSCRMMLRL